MHVSAILDSVGALAVCIWTYLLLARGGFWRIARFAHRPQSPRSTHPRVAAIVPARNEADVVGACVESLLEQRGVDLHVFLVDDNSEDGTANAARTAAKRIAKSANLTVISGRPLPPGWSGKLWAVQQGVERALETHPDFLLFTDADVVHAPDNVAQLIATAYDGRYALTSLMVKLHCRSVAEKLLIPAFVFFFFKLYPPAWIADPARRTAGAAGGCMMLGPDALEAAGGIAAIRGEIIDDCALALAVKRSGGRVYLGVSRETESVRPYGSFAEIGRMIARTAFNQLNHSALLLLGSLIGLTLTYLAPILLLFSGRAIPSALGAVAWLLMTIAYLPVVRFYALNPLWALTLPATAAFYMGATLRSAFMFWLGQGGQWKGRAQDAHAASTDA